MRKIILIAMATFGLLAATLPLSAARYGSCNEVPKAEWAKCVWERNSEHSSQ